MTPIELKEACTALYGHHWQAALARDIEVSTTTIQNWVKEVHQIPTVVHKYLDLKLNEALLQELKKEIANAGINN